MPNELARLKDLTNAGFGKIVEAVNRLVETKNRLEGDASLVAWASWTAAQFEAAGCSPAVAAACVSAMTGLVAAYQGIKTQIVAERFPPNAV